MVITMKNKDKLTIIVFVVLVILILGVFIIYNHKNKELSVDRKIKYIFENFTYDYVYNESSKLFLKGIDLLNENVFLYEKDENDRVKYYFIYNYNKYKKITNFAQVNAVFIKDEINKFMELKNIIMYESSYYIEDYQEDFNNTYVGSTIELDSYDEHYVYFNSDNFYCDNANYVGLLYEEPNCNYKVTKTKFTVALENKDLKLNNLEEIKNIVK